MKRYHLGLRLLCGVLLAVVFSMLIRWSGAAETMPPELSAASAVLIDGTTGRVLFEKNAHEERAMASTTKIMTALITLEQPDLDAMFTVCLLYTSPSPRDDYRSSKPSSA